MKARILAAPNLGTEDIDTFVYSGHGGYDESAGLALIVQGQMELDPYGKAVFLFCGRSRKTVKAIVWDGNGWLTVGKHLECPMRFKWPEDGEEARKVGLEEILGMLKGHDVWREFEVYRPEFV